MYACKHLDASRGGSLVDDPCEPKLLSCVGCCASLSREETAFNPDADDINRVLGVSPGWSLGDVITPAWCEQHPELGIMPGLSQTGIPTIFQDGQAVGSIYIVRWTHDGPTLVFPGASRSWTKYVIHPDDLYVLLGHKIEPLMFQRAGTLWDFMTRSLQGGKLDLTVRSALRLQ